MIKTSHRLQISLPFLHLPFPYCIPWPLVSIVNATHCYKASMLSLLSSSAFIKSIELSSNFTLQVSLVWFLILGNDDSSICQFEW